ncbi:hypothetical protein [Terriglobus saanensis]|nr:hypothetical protein [Terriglobus saanensis]
MSPPSSALADFRTTLAQLIKPDDYQRSINRLLLTMAEARQASLSAETYLIYGKALSPFDMQDVRGAIAELAMEIRGEGQTAMPELGRVLAVAKRLRGQRLEAERQEKERREHEEWVEYLRNNPEERRENARIFTDAVSRMTDDRHQAAPMDQDEKLRRLRESMAARTYECAACEMRKSFTPADFRAEADRREQESAEKENAARFATEMEAIAQGGSDGTAE